MKEIKTKPENGKPRLLDSAAKAPKTAMKDAWLKSKEKAVSELKGTPFASQQGETSNAPANSAGDQMLSGIETTAKKSANITYRGGKKLAQTTARKVKEKREISRTLSEAKNAGSKATEITKDTASKIRTKNTAAKAVKGKPQKAVKTASRSMKGVKNSAKGIKTAQRSAKTAQQAAKTAQATAKAAQKAAQAAKATAKATIAGVKAAVRVTIAAVKATIAAVKGLIAAIAAGGWVAVVIILLICLIALIVGSCFGLFFGSDSTGTGTSVTDVYKRQPLTISTIPRTSMRISNCWNRRIFSNHKNLHEIGGMLLNKFLKKIGSLTNRKKDNKPTNALPLGKKGRLGFSSYAAVVLCACCLSTTAFAASGDPLGVVNNLSTFIFSLIRAIGMILLGWGVVQVGLSFQSHDPSQRSQGFLTLAGGLVITFAKEILDLITA